MRKERKKKRLEGGQREWGRWGESECGTVWMIRAGLPLGLLTRWKTEAANYRKITHFASLPCLAARIGWGWGCRLTLSYALGPSHAHEWFINPHQSFPFRFIFSPSLSQKYLNIILRHFTESCRVAVVMFPMIFGGFLNQSYLQPGVSAAPQTQTQSCYQFKCFPMKHQAPLNLLDVINYLLTNAITNMRLN